MINVSAAGGRIETREDLGSGDAARFAYWEMQEKIAEKEERAWIRRAREIVKRYRDERPQASLGTRFNILWSNVQTLAPTLYARTPKPDVERRFHDQDPVGRLAAIMLERCLAYALDAFNFDAVMRAVVEDRCCPVAAWRGCCMCRTSRNARLTMKASDSEQQTMADRLFERALIRSLACVLSHLIPSCVRCRPISARLSTRRSGRSTCLGGLS